MERFADVDGHHGKHLKALILSAGLGSRLRPLTHVLPKPLAPVMNTSLFEAALFRCLEAGVSEVAVNVFHLAEVMTAAAKQACKKVGAHPPFISRESPEILGTGGALAQIIDWWDRSPLLVYNGDILSDINMLELIKRHRSAASIVTMVVHASPPKDGGRSVWILPSGEVKAICRRDDLPLDLRDGGLRECGFACAYVADPELQQYLPNPAKFHDVIISFTDALAAGKKILAIEFNGFWADVGNPKCLWETNLKVAHLEQHKILKLLGNQHGERIRSGVKNAQVDAQSVIGSGVSLGAGAQIIRSVLLDGAVVLPGEVVRDTIRGLGLDQKF